MTRQRTFHLKVGKASGNEKRCKGLKITNFQSKHVALLKNKVDCADVYLCNVNCVYMWQICYNAGHEGAEGNEVIASLILNLIARSVSRSSRRIRGGKPPPILLIEGLVIPSATPNVLKRDNTQYLRDSNQYSSDSHPVAQLLQLEMIDIVLLCYCQVHHPRCVLFTVKQRFF